jgi:hypothetical protein
MASSAVTALLSDWQANGPAGSRSLFTASCPQTNTADDGNCWWWSAVAWNALITYAEDNPGPTATTIESDLWATYTYICDNPASDEGSCPAAANQSGKDPFTINAAGNTYFDDIGWWEQTWLNAYALVGRPYYLYLAEELWNYVTNNGYHDDVLSGTPCGGVTQFHKGDGTTPAYGTDDSFANALYLRDSTLLWQDTAGQSFGEQYMGGAKLSWATGRVGGAVSAASWIRQHLVFNYAGTMGNPGALFMIAGQYAPDSHGNCTTTGNLSATQAQGEMVLAWTDMAAACGITGAGCSGSPSYYSNLADELANSVIADQQEYNGDGSFSWLFEGDSGQAEPTVDASGVLSEPCEPPGVTPGSKSDPWPDGCSLGTSMTGTDTFKSYMISKGIFEQAIYCSNHSYADRVLKDFAHTSGSNILNANFEFLWDDNGGSSTVQNFATHTSALDGLEADAEAPGVGGSYAMC